MLILEVPKEPQWIVYSSFSATSDDFSRWNKQLLSAGRPRGRCRRLHLSKIMTILIHFHQSNYRNFKAMS